MLLLEIWFAASILLGGLWALVGLTVSRASSSARSTRGRRRRSLQRPLEPAALTPDVVHPPSCLSLGS